MTPPWAVGGSDNDQQVQDCINKQKIFIKIVFSLLSCIQQDPVMLISAVIGPSYNTDVITAALERYHGDVDAAVNNLDP